ncbi:MAG TPA: hypothetical protein VHZ04_00515 [Candidatus Paceibacterota bacterium]|jgi:hypothetical protein|nr:hypothetical protein [Candidatus Paceibacterota bacterium]
MLKIIDNKIWHDAEKIGWVDGAHIRSEENGEKLGYIQDPFIFNEAGHKVAYIKENELMFENGQSPIALEHVNAEVTGTYPLLMKCAVYVLLEE